MFAELRTILIASALCVILCAVTGTVCFFKGESYQQNKQVKEDLSEVKTYDQIKNKNVQLSDPDLNKRLSKWMRRQPRKRLGQGIIP